MSVRISRRQIIRLQIFVSLNKIAENKDNSKATHVVYLELKKAVHRVDHSILVAKLQALGVSARLLKMIENYLCDRRQFVRIDEANSSETKVIRGVPQSSRLGPLFFLVCINDLPETFKDLFVIVFLMADNSKLVRSGATLQQSLASLEKGSLANKMEFYPSKSKIVTFSGLHPEYKLCNESIGAVNSQRDLGPIVSSNLSWSEHIFRRLGKAYGSLNLPKRNVSTKLRVSAKLNLYKSTVVAVISYASPCLYVSRADMRKLELLQRCRTKRILPAISNYKERLVFLEVLSIALYLQVLDVLTLTEICNGAYDLFWEAFISLKEVPRREKIPGFRKPWFESPHNEFFARTSRLLSFLPSINITRPISLKPLLHRIFWQYFTVNIRKKNNFCYWRIACRCHNCIGLKTLKLWFGTRESPLNMLL